MSEDTGQQTTLSSEENTEAQQMPQPQASEQAGEEAGEKPALQATSEPQAPLAVLQKKRGRPSKQQSPSAQATGEAPGEGVRASSETATPAQKSAPRKKTRNKFRLSRFDKDAVKLIQEGTQNVMRISALLGVEASEVRKRFIEFEKRGLLAFDANATDRVCLTVKGYNELKLAPTKEAAETREKQPVREQAQTAAVQKEIEMLAEKPVEPQLEDERVDLAEMLKRGAPREASVFVRRQERRGGAEEKVVIEEKKLDVQTTELLKKTMRAYEGEKCELCRGEFKLALEGGHPKYGHCFCGAAYHKDCYESLLDGTRSCARCGRALEIILDRQSQEAVNAIRKLFE